MKEKKRYPSQNGIKRLAAPVSDALHQAATTKARNRCQTMADYLRQLVVDDLAKSGLTFSANCGTCFSTGWVGRKPNVERCPDCLYIPAAHSSFKTKPKARARRVAKPRPKARARKETRHG